VGDIDSDGRHNTGGKKWWKSKRIGGGGAEMRKVWNNEIK
jgi:hypothetical protein